MKFETAADLLTWKNGEVEENVVLEFAQQYENLTDEEKSELIEIAKSAHKEYVQKIIKRVKQPRKRMMEIELSNSGPKGEVQEDQIQDAMKLVEYVNEKVKPTGKKMKLDTVNFSLVSATP
jgi:hypothetical protein